MKIRRKQREKRTHALKWGLLIALVALCFITFQGIQGVLRVVDEWSDDLPSLENTDAFNYAQQSVMLASDGTTELAEFQLEKRSPVTYEEISPFVLDGTVDTEDVRFYEHNGVDPQGIARALVNNLQGSDLEGASTITQQLIRNTVLSQEANDISFKRKIREAELAIELEKEYSKDEILVMYLNTINYADGCYGIEAAAQNYFQVSALDLTLAQAATLIGIPQSPTYLNPKVNPDASLDRRNVVLDRMLTAGHITQEEHDAAQAEPLNLNPAPDAPPQGIYNYPYFTSYVSSLLQEEGNRYGVSHSDLFEGGLTIYTTLDTTMQDQAEAACQAQYDRMDDSFEASLVAVDPQTGYIKALVGGKDYYADQWNIATQGGRPTGSSFKAFTLATAIEQGISPSTLIDCTSPLSLSNGKTLENYDGYDYGILSIQGATDKSSNTGYYRLAEEVSPSAIADMAHRMGVTSDLPDYPIITLGTENTTPLEMASAYGTFATGGIQRDSVAITKIVDKNGDTIYEASDSGKRVLTEEVAGAATKVLRTVFDTPGSTAYGAGPANGQPVAGKTGTGESYLDHWLVGYAPMLSCAVWLGDRNNESADRNLTANGLWQDFMSRALADQPVQDFPETKDPPYDNPYNKEQDQKYGGKSDPSKAPSTVGRTLSEAMTLLDGYDVTQTEEYSPTVTAGIVISQSGHDDQIVLVVSKGPDPAVEQNTDPEPVADGPGTGGEPPTLDPSAHTAT